MAPQNVKMTQKFVSKNKKWYLCVLYLEQKENISAWQRLSHRWIWQGSSAFLLRESNSITLEK